MDLNYLLDAVSNSYTGISGGNNVNFKRLAAKIGKGKAMFRLGVFFHEGYGGVKKDVRQSMKWIMKAIKNEYAPAMSYLGVIYNTGDGVTVNKAKAIELWNKAMALGDCLGYLYMAVAYKNGDGVIRDVVKADLLWSRFLELAEQSEK
ncbi:MAG: sel1 repeat family protein [Deltaproteobacteria bacterium]|jgi:TPR repeat protein|nr:sel1 repeat family protein [Deltaproteobacteria bacterium]